MNAATLQQTRPREAGRTAECQHRDAEPANDDPNVADHTHDHTYGDDTRDGADDRNPSDVVEPEEEEAVQDAWEAEREEEAPRRPTPTDHQIRYWHSDRKR